MPLLCLALFPDQLYYYLIVFTVVGLLGGQASPAAKAYTVDCTSEDSRAQVFGLQGAILGGVVALTPALAGLIDRHYGQQTLRITAVCVVSSSFIAARFIPESLPPSKRKGFECSSFGCSKLGQTLQQLFLRRGSVLWDMAVVHFIGGAISGAPNFFAFKSLLDMQNEDYSLLLTINSITGIFVQTLLLKLAIRCGCSHITMMGCCMAVHVIVFTGYTLLEIFPAKWFLFSLSALSSLTKLYRPAFDALATRGLKDDKGVVFGTFAAVDNVGSLVWPLLMAGVYQVYRVAPFMLVAALNLLRLILLAKLRIRMRSEGEVEVGVSTSLGA
jgi:DHA1 family tetracycline resistance protein-like MFS transporter